MVVARGGGGRGGRGGDPSSGYRCFGPEHVSLNAYGAPAFVDRVLRDVDVTDVAATLSTADH